MQYPWLEPKKIDPNRVAQIQKSLGLPTFVVQILIQRGYDSTEKIEQFLNLDLAGLTTPDHFHDLDKAVARIEEAIENNQKITIYGDYDADGVTSTSILVEAFETLGVDVNYYIPSRFKDGYGPNLARYQAIVADGTELLITVDNGISGHEPIAYAQSHGVDVIVTDHHDLPAELPAAYAIVHPRHPESTCSFGYFSGAGVAFYVAWALLGDLPVELLDLAAIGTIADVMPLTADNRLLVAAGLKQMQTGERLGLTALAKSAKLDLSQVNAHDVGFIIAPRLNSLGRVKSGRPAVVLLTTFDPDQAAEIAQDIEATNQERQQLVQEVVTQVAATLANTTQPTALVVAGENWAEGVLGIVASRLVDQYQCPTLVLSINPETGLAKGSGRSRGSFNLFAALDDFREQMVNFGGHAGAVGLTIAADQIDALRAHLVANAEEHQAEVHSTTGIQVDVELTTDQIQTLTPELVASMTKTLGPFGEQNPEPVIELSQLTWQSWSAIGKTKQTLKGVLNAQVEAIAFRMGELAPQLSSPLPVTLIGSLGMNTWNKQTKVQINVLDFDLSTKEQNTLRDVTPVTIGPEVTTARATLTTSQPSASQSEPRLSPDSGQLATTDKKVQLQVAQHDVTVIDWRQKAFDEEIWSQPQTYVCFNPKLGAQLQARFTNSVRITNLPQLEVAVQDLLFVDLPTDIQLFTRYLSHSHAARIYLLFYTSPAMKERLQVQIPQLRYLLKEIIQQQTIEVSQLTLFAQHCHLTMQQLSFGLRVFSELNFVKIDKERIQAQPQAPKRPLSESATFLRQQALQKSYRELAVGSLKQIETFLKSSQTR